MNTNDNSDTSKSDADNVKDDDANEIDEDYLHNACFENAASKVEGQGLTSACIDGMSDQYLYEVQKKKEKDRHSTVSSIRRRRPLRSREGDLETLCEASEKESERKTSIEEAPFDEAVKTVCEKNDQGSKGFDKGQSKTAFDAILPSLHSDSNVATKIHINKDNDEIIFPSISESTHTGKTEAHAPSIEHNSKPARKKGLVVRPSENELDVNMNTSSGEKHKEECVSNSSSKNSAAKGKEAGHLERIASTESNKSFTFIDEFLVKEENDDDLSRKLSNAPKDKRSEYSNCVEECLMDWRRRGSKKSKGQLKDGRLLDGYSRSKDKSSLARKHNDKNGAGKGCLKEQRKGGNKDASKRKKKSSKDEGSIEEEILKEIMEKECKEILDIKKEEKRSAGSKDGVEGYPRRKTSVYAKGNLMELAAVIKDENSRLEIDRHHLAVLGLAGELEIEGKGQGKYHSGMSLKRNRKFSRASETPIAIHNYLLNEGSKSRLEGKGHRMRKFSIMSLPTDPRSMTPRSKKLFSLNFENTIIFRYSERPFSCLVDAECCYRSQTSKEQVDHHRSRHFSKLPYVCTLCFDQGSRMAFETKGDLENHEKTIQHEQQRDRNW